jgi:hypothetical protein
VKRVVFLALFFIGVYVVGYSEPQKMCLKGNCENGYGAMVFASGLKYIGFFKDGKPHGKGTLYYPHTSETMAYYIGDFKGGVPHGKGTLYFKDGEKLKGDWKFGFPAKFVDKYLNAMTPEERSQFEFEEAMSKSK